MTKPILKREYAHPVSFPLPPLCAQAPLEFEWFPTRAHCFVFRNYGLAGVDRLAAVLGCGPDEVERLAKEMGLGPEDRAAEGFEERGFVTLVRNNWHVLDYDGLAALLGIDVNELAKLLRESDFLDVKMGGSKPPAGGIAVEQLKPGDEEKLALIRSVMDGIRDNYREKAAERFDFFNFNSGGQGGCPAEGSGRSGSAEGQFAGRFRNRMIYSYSAVFGDLFGEGERAIEKAFPEELLAEYSRLGINGLWAPALLRELAPFPFFGDAVDGGPAANNEAFAAEVAGQYQKRLENMRKTVDRLGRYGIRLFIYLNEPRSLPEEAFRDHPSIKGDVSGSDASLCVAADEVRNWLRDSAEYIVRNVPGLGGFITITASENKTNCYSGWMGKPPAGTGCPHCSRLSRERVFADVNNLIAEGAKRADPNFEVIAWNWGWDAPGSSEASLRALDFLDNGISAMCVSEGGARKNVKGTETVVIDYSISVGGPGECARSFWGKAASQGRRSYAKMQVSNTWEISAVPFLPVFRTVYGHLKRICETGSVTDLMLGWTLGGYPGDTLRMASFFYGDAGENRRSARIGQDGENGQKLPVPPLEEIYRKMYPGACVDRLAAAFDAFSDAFDSYPFSLGTIYTAPFQYGPANLLFTKKTGYRATMVGFPYDDVDSWRSNFPGDTFRACLEEMADKWEKGLELLDGELDNIRKTVDNCKKSGENCEKSVENVETSVDTLRVLESIRTISEAVLVHFRSVLNQFAFVCDRDRGVVRRDLLESESALAMRLIGCVRNDPRIGFEASNHYFYTERNLAEKMINCEYLLRTSGCSHVER
jgi:hypothetical protein